MMQAASRRALDTVRSHQLQANASRSAPELIELADQAYSVADLLVRTPQLRRALGDPAAQPQDRVGLAERLLSGRIAPPALDLVDTAVRQRWSSPWDLADTLELAGDDALFAAADTEHATDQVEDELFRLERILQTEGDFTALLDEYSTPAERRVGLLDSVLAAKVHPITRRLVEHAVASERKRSITLALDELVEQAAGRHNQAIARVLAAQPLSEAQEARLEHALARIYGRRIMVRTSIDTTIEGGLIVRVADDVIDGSVLGRLLEARSGLAG